MDSEDVGTKKTRGRGRGSRARGRGRGRARGRGKKATRIVSSDEEISPEQVEDVPEEPPQAITETVIEVVNKENEMETSNEENIPPPTTELFDMEADISQLEAPTFTTISRGPPEPMLRLKWDHKVSLIGEKVLNPMIHCCDECDKPILVYGRMIPCKHIFCLKCARAEPIKICPRCKDKVVRVEQSGLGTVFMCTHGGSRYGNTGCRRTYLSQRDLQAHINHRHITPQAISNEASVIKNTQMMDAKSTNVQQRKSGEAPSQPIPSTASSSIRPQPRCSNSQQYSSNISVVQASLVQSRANLINIPIQEAQQALGKVSLQQSTSASTSQSLHTHHVSEALAAAFYSTSLQSYGGGSTGTYSVPSVHTVMTQNYGTIPTITPQTGTSVLPPVVPPQSVIHNMQLVAPSTQVGSRPTAVPPPPAPPQAPAYYAAYGQQYGQMPHYQYDQPNFTGNTSNQQHWNQQQYYR